MAIDTDGKTEGVEDVEIQDGNEEIEAVSKYIPRDVVEDLASYFNDMQEEDIPAKFSLRSLLVGKEDYEDRVEADGEASLDEIEARQEVPEPFAEAMSEFYQQILDDKGFDGTRDDLLIRWVGTNDPGNLSRIIDESKSDVADHEEGIDMNQLGPDADEYFATQIKSGEKGVLLVYDGRKVGELDDEGMRKDAVSLGHYGYKPKEGQTYKSALLGALAFT